MLCAGLTSPFSRPARQKASPARRSSETARSPVRRQSAVLPAVSASAAASPTAAQSRSAWNGPCRHAAASHKSRPPSSGRTGRRLKHPSTSCAPAKSQNTSAPLPSHASPVRAQKVYERPCRRDQHFTAVGQAFRVRDFHSSAEEPQLQTAHLAAQTAQHRPVRQLMHKCRRQQRRQQRRGRQQHKSPQQQRKPRGNLQAQPLRAGHSRWG